ncbi:putative RNA-directed DNA polymerase, eukaryota, reverse transcriptase zinc-binding domain protein [Tanacetum coccineum]
MSASIFSGNTSLEQFISLEVQEHNDQAGTFSIKIVAKILAKRFSKVIDSIISPEQSAFISSRQILDGPLILSGIIDWYKKCKKFKVDFEKAFDSDFYPRQWESYFRVFLKEMRQGDTLSPFLFIIVMEGLHMTLNENLAANMFHGVTIGSSGIHLSHLFYADVVIILSDWNQNDMENIIRILNIFYIASVLKINIHKSNIFGVRIMRSFLWLHVRCEPGGRLTLIKSVLGSLGIYYLSIFKVPEIVVKSLESLRVAFFWGGHEHTKKIAWVKSSNTLASLDKGGFGAGSLKAFNKALLLKMENGSPFKIRCPWVTIRFLEGYIV